MKTADRDGRPVSTGTILDLSWSKRMQNIISLNVVVKQVQGKQQDNAIIQYIHAESGVVSC